LTFKADRFKSRLLNIRQNLPRSVKEIGDIIPLCQKQNGFRRLYQTPLV